MFNLVSMTLSYPFGTSHTVVEPPASLYFAPTATSRTVTLDNGFRFAAEPLNWVGVDKGMFKQVKDLTKEDKLLVLIPSTTYSYSAFGPTSPQPIIIQQRQLYVRVTSSALSSTSGGMPTNSIIPVLTVAPTNVCFCLISDVDCRDGGNLIPTPLVTIV